METLARHDTAASRPGDEESTPALRLTGLHKVFADNVAVNHVDLMVPRGSFFGLVGPNGAGKTTALSIALAVATIWLSLLHSVNPNVIADLLAAVYLMWMLGWIIGPVWGGATVLRVEHFALLSVPRRRLAYGLLGAVFVGITTAVTLLAFLSLIVYAARLGLVPALVAVPGVVLQWPVVAVMILLGLGLYYIAVRATIVRKPSPPDSGDGDHAVEPVGTSEAQRAEFGSV